mgnify:CR=1 FL=1
MDMKLKKLQETRQEKIDALESIINSAEERNLSAEERDNCKAFQEEIKSLDEEIDLVSNVRSVSTRKLTPEVSGESEKRKHSGLVGLTDKEVQQFSITKLVRHLSNRSDSKLREDAAFELETSRAAEEKLGRSANGAIIPHDVLLRDLTKGTNNAGGFLVGTDHQGQSFIDLLRAASVVVNRARMLTDLVGDVAIPRLDNGAAAEVVTEGNSPSEGSHTYAQVALKAHTVAAHIDVSRKLLLQSSPSVDALVFNDLAQSIALKLDALAINGSGSDEPTGILATNGIGSVAMGTNGDNIDWASVVALETEVNQDNALAGDLSYVTNPKVVGAAKTTEKATGTAQFLMNDQMLMNGYNALSSTQVPSGGTKGTGTNLSTLLFGNFADAVLAMWSGLDINVDESSLSTSGGKRIVALQDMDYAVRRPQSFAAITDIVTA